MVQTRKQQYEENRRNIYTNVFKKYSAIIGEVIGSNAYGCYVRDRQTDCVVFYYGCGTRGDKVLLTVDKVDVEHEKVTCTLESVLEYGEFAA